MSQQLVHIIKKQNLSEQNRDKIPADQKESLLKSIEYFETQAGRLMKMAREIRAEVLSLTAK